MLMSPHKLSKATVIATANDRAFGSSRKEKDCISQLPDELIHTILSYLNLRDAVKTSVLSRRWNHVYTSPSRLQFDWDTIQPEFRNACGKPCVLYKEKFVGAINQFLRFYQGSNLSMFTVKCCLDREWTNDIDGWVRFALGQGTEMLTLDLYCNKSCSLEDKHKKGRGVEGKYVLESELFEGLVASKLKHLNLVACSFGKNLTCHFSCLEELSFSYSPLARYHLNSLFPCLPKLKVLTFTCCIFPTKLCINLLPLLERFSIYFPDGLKEIELSNVNLVSFSSVCPPNVLFDLRGVPNLNHFTYAVPSPKLQHVFTHLSEQLPKLSSLYIVVNYNWVKYMPGTVFVFRQVRWLFLALDHEEFYALKIISILRAFPHLVELCLMTRCKEDFDEEMAEADKYVPKHLKKVEMRGFRSTPNQMEFAVYMLKNAFALKQLIIKSEIKFKPDPEEQPMDETERRIVTQRLRKFAKDKVLLVIG